MCIGTRLRSWATLRPVLTLALVLGCGTGITWADGDESLPDAAKSPNLEAYEPIGRVVLMHSGRRKPMDTLARQEVKIITGRQSFEPVGPDGQKLGEWEALPAFFSWWATPETWEDRQFLLVEYLPLKEQLLAGRVQALLQSIHDEAKDEDLKTKLKPLLEADRVNADQLFDIARHAALSDAQQDKVEAWAHRLSGADKYLSPREVQEALVRVDGRSMRFPEWFAEVARRSQSGSMSGMGGAAPKLDPLDEKLLELSKRLARFKVIASETAQLILPPVDHMIPRPSNEKYLGFLTETVGKYEKIRNAEENKGLDFPVISRVRRDKVSNDIFVETAGGREIPLEDFLAVLGTERLGFNEVERDAIQTLIRHDVELQADDRRVPGQDAEADEEFLAWLREDSDWAPLSLILSAPVEDLVAAGYPEKELVAFRDATAALREAEAADPGEVPTATAQAFLDRTRDLASAVSQYPSVAAVNREVYYNTFAPFYKAPMLYGLGAILLGATLTFRPRPGSGLAKLRSGLYGVGLLAFIAAIGLEIYGFYLRVMISGWAPVTNMYETVIWVALVAAVIGLVLELIYRRGYAGAAASAVAMLCTIIAANATSVLNPNIESLQPVLRSNYWLTIHVLTIVSSYAAFALAMGLGLIGIWYYLTATYRRDVSYSELARPLLPGIPVALIGLALAYPATVGLTLGESVVDAAFYFGWLVASTGILMSVMAITGIAGETISRMVYRESEWMSAERTTEARLEASSSTTANAASLAEAAENSHASHGGSSATAVLEAPPSNRDSGGSQRGTDGWTPRERSMQATAAQLKPLVNYIYRALQVGVLLVAAGTILGGVWADYSWGRFWGWDPKEVSALITLLAYLVPLHGRFAGWIKTFGMVCASIFCFNFVLIAWYGVNFLLGVGLHSYGFAEGGNQGAVLLSTLVVNAVVAGTIWRRSLAYRPAPGQMA